MDLNEVRQLTPTSENKVKARAVYDHMKNIHGDICKADRLALTLLCQPDATANQIMAVHESLSKTRTWYRTEHHRLSHMFAKCQGFHGPRFELLALNY